MLSYNYENDNSEKLISNEDIEKLREDRRIKYVGKYGEEFVCDLFNKYFGTTNDKKPFIVNSQNM